MNDIDFEHAAEALAGRYEERDKISTMLSCVCNAISNAQAEQNKVLERIATALEAGHNEPAAATLMRGVGLDHEETIEGSYIRKPSIELRRGLYGFGGVYRDDAGGSWFALDLDQELRADSPEDLRDIAELFRSNFADALEWAAAEWQEQLDAGEARLLEPDNDDDIADEDNELED